MIGGKNEETTPQEEDRTSEQPKQHDPTPSPAALSQGGSDPRTQQRGAIPSTGTSRLEAAKLGVRRASQSSPGAVAVAGNDGATSTVASVEQIVDQGGQRTEQKNSSSRLQLATSFFREDESQFATRSEAPSVSPEDGEATGLDSPIVAELAIDEDELEARIAGRLRDELAQEVEQQVQDRLVEVEREQVHTVAEVVKVNDDESTRTICGMSQRFALMMLMLVVVAVIVVVVAVLVAGNSPTNAPPTTAIDEIAICADEDFFDSLTEQLSTEFNSEIFLSQPPDPNDPPVPSTLYKFEDFVTALKNLQDAGGSNVQFWYGDSGDGEDCTIDHQKAALVNMAAFLGQAIRQSIMYDSCDENNVDIWRADISKEPESPPDLLTSLYPMSSSCGQMGENYAGYRCEDECPQDLSLEMTATTNAGWSGAPPPLFCGPKSKFDDLGYWNPHRFCRPDSEVTHSCDGEPFYYEGQRGGIHVPASEDSRFPDFFYSNPLPDASGVTPSARTPDAFPSTNVEGCCWWGRGVIQTTGRCNFGKLNKFVGAGAGSDALYPDINFCQNPQAVCSGPSELKWVAGIFFWVSAAQKYDSGGFNFKEGVREFVDMGCAGNPDMDGCDFLFEGASKIVDFNLAPFEVSKRVESSKKVLRALMKLLGEGDGPASTAPPTVLGPCGGGSVGNGVCANSSDCCSQFGWCGTTADHCGDGRRVLRRVQS